MVYCEACVTAYFGIHRVRKCIPYSKVAKILPLLRAFTWPLIKVAEFDNHKINLNLLPLHNVFPTNSERVLVFSIWSQSFLQYLKMIWKFLESISRPLTWRWKVFDLKLHSVSLGAVYTQRKIVSESVNYQSLEIGAKDFFIGLRISLQSVRFIYLSMFLYLYEQLFSTLLVESAGSWFLCRLSKGCRFGRFLRVNSILNTVR